MAEQSQPLVITLWETYGSNMDAVARRLSTELSLPLHEQAYSSDAIEEAAAAREKEGPLGRLLHDFNPTNFGVDGSVSPAWSGMETNYAKMAEENTPKVLADAAAGGIIQGRNGQWVLRDRPNTLHVKLDGPVEARARNAAPAGIGEERARKRQRVEDDFRSRLSQHIYQFDPRDNDHYDLVINGAELGVDAAVAIIKAAAQAKLS